MQNNQTRRSLPSLQPRHLRRYRQIVEIMARHGFGAILFQLGLEQRLNLPRRLLRRRPTVETTPAEHVRLALEELGPTFVKLAKFSAHAPTSSRRINR